MKQLVRLLLLQGQRAPAMDQHEVVQVRLGNGEKYMLLLARIYRAVLIGEVL